jgi:HAD superfamily hydrolase (TIGR01450 family)
VAFDFSPFDAVLLDLDGTIYHEEHPLPGAVDLVRRLQREGRNFACLSNSTTSPSRLAQRLARMHMPIGPERIYTAAAAAADYVLERYGPNPSVLNLSTEGIEEMLDGKVRWLDSADAPCRVVIAGAPVNVYATEHRQRAALAQLRKGADLVGICADRVYPSPRGIEFGSGAFCSMLGYAANVQPIFCGKPQPVFFNKLCEKLGVEPCRCLLIGDNLESDIGGAKGVGMKTVLTCTGVACRADLERLPPDALPDRVVDDLTALL